MSDIWKSLKFVTGKAIDSAGYRYKFRESGSVKYQSHAPSKIMHVSALQRWAMQQAQVQTVKLAEKYTALKQTKVDVSSAVQAKKQTLVEAGKAQMKSHGSIKADGGGTIDAKDRFGNVIKEALMMYYTGETLIHYNTTTINANGKTTTTELSTKTLCHIDLTPDVSVKSGKEIVMTKVQGRDYTRKELISGTDLTFSIKGSIVSNLAGVYPDAAVQKLIQLSQYKGIVEVNHFIFKQFNVSKVIITDFALDAQDYKNVQPYSMSCVAVEPDTAVDVSKDTISIVNTELANSPENKWYNAVLNNKLVELGKRVGVTNTTQAVQYPLNLLNNI
jgi:Domain of unknown function (DUF6046)